ncbi:MAG: SDR family NAD(P)-dependent oxidoreductase [Pseudomonadota bacterium]
MEDVAGKVAFITGGASGIGLGIATAFLKAGSKVVIGDIQPERLKKAENQLKALSADVHSVVVDATSMDSVENAANEVEAAFGKVHIVCNNAGMGGSGKILDVPMEKWHRQIDLNLWGVLHGIKAFLPRILDHNEGGHIVNTASFSGIVGHHSQAGYGTSKFAVVGMTEFLRNDLADSPVSASVLCPHIVDTPIFYPDIADADEATIAERKKTMPWLATLAVSPEEVGDMVLRGIKTNELYIFCDGKASREMLESRTKALFEAMGRQFPQ